MTSITLIGRPSIGARLRSSLARLPGTFLTRIRAYQARRQSAIALEALPFDLLKDIGWPGSDTGSTRTATRHAGVEKRA